MKLRSKRKLKEEKTTVQSISHGVTKISQARAKLDSKEFLFGT